jgi:hypothetical protein
MIPGRKPVLLAPGCRRRQGKPGGAGHSLRALAARFHVSYEAIRGYLAA